MNAEVLVVAKAPVPGLAKTRLAATVGAAAAADLAAAAFLDTLEACVTAFGDRCHLALAGDLDAAAHGEEIREALTSWRVFDQRGETFAQRLAHAHRAMPAQTGVLQIGTDTPQVMPDLLTLAASQVRPGRGVLGMAVDGGWWALGLADRGAADALVDVPMSTGDTGRATRDALAAAGIDLAPLPTLRDVDTAADAASVAAAAPTTRFAQRWLRHESGAA